MVLPFVTKPPGFEAHSLHLLDIALTRAWMEQVATGAMMSGADGKLCAALWNQVAQLDGLTSGGRKPRRKHRGVLK